MLVKNKNNSLEKEQNIWQLLKNFNNFLSSPHHKI